MNTINDVNKSIDSLPGLKVANEGSSILNSLFSINLNSEEIVSEKDLIDKEFLFEDDDIKIIDYISNIIPDFENKKNNLSDLSKIEHTIKSDTSLNQTEKNKILNLIKLSSTNSKKIQIMISGNKKIKKLLIGKPLKSFDNNIENDKPLNSTKNNKNLNMLKNISDVNKVKIISEDEEKFINTPQKEEINRNKKLSLNDQHSSFVKKIKKNNHPNKIYHLDKNRIIEQNKSNNIFSQVDTKSSSNILLSSLKNEISETHKKNKINEITNNNNNNLNVQQSNQINNATNNYSHNGNTSLLNNGYNSVLENFLDNLDLTQKGWTSKLVSRIENSLVDGEGEIEFNLKPKNLGLLKVSVTLKEGLGSVKIITENIFVTTALNQNENYLQKLFNDQGMNLEFSAKNENQSFGSKNDFNQNSNNKKENQHSIKEKNVELTDESLIKDKSSRHIINVIA